MYEGVGSVSEGVLCGGVSEGVLCGGVSEGRAVEEHQPWGGRREGVGWDVCPGGKDRGTVV